MKTMNKKILLLAQLVLLTSFAFAQAEPAPSDSVIERTVTVEREFQPTVQAAGKLAVKPQTFEPEMKEATVTYSDYSAPLSIEKNVHTLGYAATTFNRPYSPKGYLRGGIGHPNTMLDFNYRVDSRSEGWLDLHARHFGQWGRKMLEKSSLGLDYRYAFDKAQLYFSAEGGCEHFTHYYRYIDTLTTTFYPGTKLSSFAKSDFAAFYNADVVLGVQNTPGADILYQVQAAYEGFFLPQSSTVPGALLIEHQVHTQAMFEWSTGDHHLGLEAEVKNRFYTGTALTAKHCIHAEPYYAYEGRRIRLHAGVNLDLGLGGYDSKLGAAPNAFGVSPNVTFEADITKTWLSFFLNANGQLAAEGVGDELGEHRFLDPGNLLQVMTNGCCAAYTPVDAVAGLRFKPLPTLLFDIHAGYALTFDEHILGYNIDEKRFFHFEQDRQIAKVGAQLHYHYQDIFTMQLDGDYFFAPSRLLLDKNGTNTATAIDLIQGDFQTEPYDHYKWMIHARFDGRINRHWSLYSDNYLYGKRHALIVANSAGTGSPLQKREDKILHEVFDLNLGVEYAYNDRLAFFAQLNNYLAFTPQLTAELLYNTPAQGANCLFGVSWNF